MPAVIKRRRRRWLPSVGLAALVVVGLSLAVGPAAGAERFPETVSASLMEFVPTVTVTGTAGCTSFQGETSVYWKVLETAAPEGYYYGGDVTYNASPATSLINAAAYINGDVQPTQRIPRGTGATTATLTVTVVFATLPGGPRTVTSSGSVALPFCPIHVRASAELTMMCDRSVEVTVDYPSGAEIATSVSVYGTSLTGARWESGVIPLRAGGEVRTVVVPSPYTNHVVVTQVDGSETQPNVPIGSALALNQPQSCLFPTTTTTDPGGQPSYPQPGAGGGASSGGASSGGVSGAGGGDGPGGGAYPQPSSSDLSGVQPSESARPSTSSTTRTDPIAVATADADAASGSPPFGRTPLVMLAMLGTISGLVLAMFLGAGAAAYLAVRRRRSDASAG